MYLETRVYFIMYKKSYFTLSTHNYLEEFNKNTHLFIPSLIQMLKEKGHTYEFNGRIKNRVSNKRIIEKLNAKIIKTDDKNVIRAKAIYEATKIDLNLYNTCIDKLRNNDANKRVKLAIKRFEYETEFNIDLDNIDFDEFYDNHYGKLNIRNNYKDLCDPTRIIILPNQSGIDMLEVDFTNKIKKDRVDLILEIIQTIGFDLNNDKKKILRDEFDKAIIKTIEECSFFGDIYGTSYTFFLESQKSKALNKVVWKL